MRKADFSVASYYLDPQNFLQHKYSQMAKNLLQDSELACRAKSTLKIFSAHNLPDRKKYKPKKRKYKHMCYICQGNIITEETKK